MIQKGNIQNLVGQVLSDDQFLVDITIGTGNVISVEVDSDKGISIGECVQISRHIEGELDRETEDFALEVTSPGLTKPFKVLRQYLKNIGREVEVVNLAGEKQKGVLKSADENGFELEVSVKEKVDKVKMMVLKTIVYTFEQVKTVKIVISFN